MKSSERERVEIDGLPALNVPTSLPSLRHSQANLLVLQILLQNRADETMHLNPALILVAASVFSAGFIVGCGGGDGLERVAVSGSVTIAGEPVPNGVVRFRPVGETQGPMANTMITDGRYEIPQDQGPVAGNYEVRVQAYEDPGDAGNATASSPPAVPSDKLKQKLPSDNPAEVDPTPETAVPKESNRTFRVTIPPLPSFQQDFAL